MIHVISIYTVTLTLSSSMPRKSEFACERTELHHNHFSSSRLRRVSLQKAPVPGQQERAIAPSPPNNKLCSDASSPSFPGGEKTKSENKTPCILFIKDYQTPVLNFYLIIIMDNNDYVDPLQGLTPQRLRFFLISICTINRAKAPL